MAPSQFSQRYRAVSGAFSSQTSRSNPQILAVAAMWAWHEITSLVVRQVLALDS
jgi:hypothetical protein